MTETKRWIGQITQMEPPELWPEIQGRAPRGDGASAAEPHPRVRTAALLVTSLLVVGSVLYAIRDLGDTDSVRSPGSTQVQRYRVDGAPQPLAVGEGAAWTSVSPMTSRGTGTPMIWRIDATTGETSPLPATLGVDWVTTGAGGVWALCASDACGGQAVLRLDPATGAVVGSISLATRPWQITAGLGSVWVTSDGGLVKVDPSSTSVTNTFPGRFDLVGTGGGSVWATEQEGGALVQLDPSTGEERSRSSFRDACVLETSDDEVFLASCGGGGYDLTKNELVAIDASTGDVLYRVPIEGYGQMRLAGGALWIAQDDPQNANFTRLVPLDPRTGAAAGSPFEVERPRTPRFSMHIMVLPHIFFAAGEGSLWFTDFGAGEIVRVGLPINGTGAPTPSPSPPGSSPAEQPS